MNSIIIAFTVFLGAWYFHFNDICILNYQILFLTPTFIPRLSYTNICKEISMMLTYPRDVTRGWLLSSAELTTFHVQNTSLSPFWHSLHTQVIKKMATMLLSFWTEFARKQSCIFRALGGGSTPKTEVHLYQTRFRAITTLISPYTSLEN